jgi:small subunit ribosomal protein S7
MPRRISIGIRGSLIDPKFGDRQVAQFLACLMKQGKRSTAENIIYAAIDEKKWVRMA